MISRLDRVVATAAATAVVAVALTACTPGVPLQPSSTDSPTSTSSSAPGCCTSAAESIVAVMARVEPSVVTIRTDDGEGSGVVYREDGVVVTNAHVVGSTRQVTVVFADGTQTAGRVRATDDVTDLAVVQVDRTGLPAAVLRLGGDTGRSVAAGRSPAGPAVPAAGRSTMLPRTVT
jgi:S1-C subfamily serine protease